MNLAAKHFKCHANCKLFVCQVYDYANDKLIFSVTIANVYQVKKKKKYVQ